MTTGTAAQAADCKTRYPIVLVHGIGYTDEDYPDYWGRVPAALTRCGAEVYFGGQDSYASVTVNAQQLKDRILAICAGEAGAARAGDTAAREGAPDKVNIIAHSKGGLDARYMISCLDMAPYVASLTTIATPHRGIGAIDTLQRKAPAVLAQLYGLFALMVRIDGGDRPDSLAVFDQLSEDYLSVFNELVPDAAGVYYQSWACDMADRKTDPPLGLFYDMVHRLQGDNDGFVPVESAKWGTFRGVYRGEDGAGISHPMACDGRVRQMEKQGREDLSSWYVQIVSELREMGL